MGWWHTISQEWSGTASSSVIFEQEPEESEGVSHVAGGGAFQNKSHEAGKCIMCSRIKQGPMLLGGKVVKDVRACGEEVVWGTRSSPVPEDSEGSGFTHYEKPGEGFQHE